MKNYSNVQMMMFFINTLRGENLAESTIVSYKTDLSQFESFLLGRKIKSFSKAEYFDVTEFRNALVIDRGLKPATVDRKIDCLRKFYRCLTKNKLLTDNIMEEFEHSRTDTDDELAEFLPFHEVKQVIAAAKKYGGKYAKRDASLLAFYGYTGCRREEGISRDFDDLNLFNKTVVLRRKKNGTVNVLEMHPELYSLVLDYYKEWKQRERREPLPDEPLFYGKKGDRVGVKDVNRLFHKYAELAGIKKEFSITPRVFRSSFVTHAALNGVDAWRIQLYTGHKCLSSLERYIKRTTKDCKKLVDCF